MPPLSYTGNKPRILIVDDMKINCDLLEYFLGEMADLDIAYNGKEAVEKATQNKYDLVLLDICLGSGLDGFEVLEMIRAQESNKDLPIIAVTGSSTELMESDFLQRGFSYFLPKPVSKQEVFLAIKKVLE